MENKDYILKKLQEIEEHFGNITEEEFHEKLINAGYGKIKSLAEFDLDLLCEDIIEESLVEAVDTSYNKHSSGYEYTNYQYSNYRSSKYTYSEVAA